MAVGEGGERLGGGEIGGGDVVVEGFEGLLEGVLVALVVAAGIADVGAGGFGDQAGIPDQLLVGLVAMADPELVGLLAVPGDGGFAAGDLITQTVLAAGGHLRDPERAVRAAGKAEKRRAAVLGLDVDRLGGLGRLHFGRKGLDFTGWPLASSVNGLQVGLHGADGEAGYELDQVQPVGADVGDGPQLAALAAQQAPFPRPLLLIPFPRIQCIAQAVAQEVERQYRDHDHEAGKERNMGKAKNKGASIGQYAAP